MPFPPRKIIGGAKVTAKIARYLELKGQKFFNEYQKDLIPYCLVNDVVDKIGTYSFRNISQFYIEGKKIRCRSLNFYKSINHRMVRRE